MRRLLTACVAALVLLAAAPVWAAERVPIDRMRRAAVTLFGRDGEPVCSGTVVNEVPVTLILTAAHCVEHVAYVGQVYRDERGRVDSELRIMLDELAVDRANDLALFKTRVLYGVGAVAEIDPAVELHAGDPVYSVSASAGLTGSVQVGVISQVEVYDERLGDTPVTQINMPGTFFGSSGGGVYTADGKLMGVYSRMIPGSSVVFVVPLKAIDFFLSTSPYYQVFGENRGGM